MTKREKSRCECGRVKSKYAHQCNRCHKESLDKICAGVQAIVETGKCPKCGSGLKRNLALMGWWQCEQYGAEGFRKDSSKPQCSWQGFTR